MPDNDDLSRRSVPAAASAFLAERYPELAGQKLVGLRLGSSWLVETEPTTPSEDSQPYKVVLMVNRHGFVEEIGPDVAPDRAPLPGRPAVAAGLVPRKAVAP